ncbi:MAG: hypothetical protein MZV63_57365 [Marinilabiliales bacterium]|nr:hypothetical protein [Marinilabiliales bacterium]
MIRYSPRYATSFIRRKLPAIELKNEPFGPDSVNLCKTLAGDLMGIGPDMADYFVFTGEVSNRTYAPDEPQVNILLKNGEIKNISEVSEMFDHQGTFTEDYKILSLLSEKIALKHN